MKGIQYASDLFQWFSQCKRYSSFNYNKLIHFNVILVFVITGSLLNLELLNIHIHEFIFAFFNPTNEPVREVLTTHTEIRCLVETEVSYFKFVQHLDETRYNIIVRKQRKHTLLSLKCKILQ